jgi:hypothetical protein
MAALRNPAISRLRLLGADIIAKPRYLFRGPAMGRLAPGSGMAGCPLSR